MQNMGGLDIQWFGDRESSDITVFLVPSSWNLDAETTGALHESRLVLAEVHAHLSVLHCKSKYFDVCFLDRWAKSGLGTESSSTLSSPVRKSYLEAHTDVFFYMDCFSRMYSVRGCNMKDAFSASAVTNYLELLKVASQIDYLELKDAIICYLAQTPWSLGDQQKIREFAHSGYYPSDCSADLNERLGLEGVQTPSLEAHSAILRMLSYCLGDVKILEYHILAGDGFTCRHFEETFKFILQQSLYNGCSHSLAKEALALVNVEAKKWIDRIVADSEDWTCIYVVGWLLTLLLECKLAKELVEYMERSQLSLHIQESFNLDDFVCNWQRSWLQTIFTVFAEVVTRQLLLNTTARNTLFKNWEWLLVYAINIPDIDKDEVNQVVNGFVLTLSSTKQTKIFKDWVQESCRVENTTEMCLDLGVAYKTWLTNQLARKDS